MTTKNIDEYVLDTLKYSSIFSYPLSFYQIAQYLGKKSTHSELNNSIKNLIQKKEITKKGNVYKLKNKKYVNWIQKQNQTKKLIKRYIKLLKKLKRIPWIQMIAFTGSLAASNPDKKDDIDIFIITKDNRLWITRFFVAVYLKFWKVYRTAENPSGKICPNILISEGFLEWPKEKQNFYVAAEIVRMQPIINKDNIYLRLLSKNKWIQNFFPNFIFEETEELAQVEAFPLNILNFVEILFFLVQRVFMMRKITTEVVRRNFIHFNKYDKTDEILGKYKT